MRSPHAVELAGYAYHADCFKCNECHSKLDETQATKGPKGKLMCAACAEAVCHRCNKNIVLGQRVRCNGREVIGFACARRRPGACEFLLCVEVTHVRLHRRGSSSGSITTTSLTA